MSLPAQNPPAPGRQADMESGLDLAVIHNEGGTFEDLLTRAVDTYKAALSRARSASCRVDGKGRHQSSTIAMSTPI